MKNTIKIFNLRGAIKNYESLREEEKEMIDTYGKVVNFMDKETIVILRICF